ncbi:AAA domain-containing protein [Trichostrongylus colubriformis]|uniref:AAA domain-containing protein n=1 Tax=Trichostrongylus colubriformis TaxID=6319 RepID=A0AAN8EYN3_TRICO
MEDEDFNVIARFDDADHSYPDHENVEPSASDVTVVNALNETGQRKRRFLDNDPFSMPPDDKFVHPMDWHMKMPLTLEEHENTRAKTDDEMAAARLFQRICQARAKRMRAMKEQLQEHKTANSDDEYEKEKQILESPPVDGSSWIGVNSDDRHERFYIRYLRQPRVPRAANVGSNEVRAEILEEQWKRIKAEIEAVRENKARMVANRQERQNLEEVHANIITNDSSIWVNKYAPQNYVDLLSDDAVNRHLMSWVKLWDECVFRRKIVNLPKNISTKEKDMLTLDSGKPRRPVQKVALLCGPAGLGKTTLANIVARQAGYAVVEQNASDSRNVPDFEKALEGAVRTSRTLDQKSRPNCLILDEIDGAPVEAIRYLVKATQATGKKAIRRPIICICNNMYTPALRELRAVALNIQVAATAKERLIQRLAMIAELEGVRIDRFALQRLVELCQCDVRFSVNTLQFVSVLAQKERRYVSMGDIQKAVERERVGSASIFENWSTMLDFSHHFDKKGVLRSLSERLQLVERVAFERGDDRFVNGLHANYLAVNLPLKSIRCGAEAFVHYDRIMLAINQKQDYSLMKYVTVFYMLLHAAVATHTRAKLKYPQQEQTALQRRRESQETLATVQSTLLGRYSPTALLCDVLPLLLQIVQPPIKTMNQQLYSTQELKEIDNIVTIMADYHLTFAPTIVNFQPQFLFQPPIDVLAMFPISDESSRNLLSNSTRQMIAQKIEIFHTTGKGSDENSAPKSNTAHIKQLVADSSKSQSAEKGPWRPLLYKFNTGCSTAVKRTIRMHQLLN